MLKRPILLRYIFYAEIILLFNILWSRGTGIYAQNRAVIGVKKAVVVR